jgi:hypothetical protein
LIAPVDLKSIGAPVRAILGASADDVFAVGGDTTGRVFRRAQDEHPGRIK